MANGSGGQAALTPAIHFSLQRLQLPCKTYSPSLQRSSQGQDCTTPSPSVEDNIINSFTSVKEVLHNSFTRVNGVTVSLEQDKLRKPSSKSICLQ